MNTPKIGGAVVWTVLAISNIGLQAQTVEAVHVISRAIERKVELPGEFMPYERVPIHAKVPGFVDSVLVDRGSVVKVGQLLATMVAPERETPGMSAIT